MLRHPPSHPSPQPRNTSEFRRYRPTSKNFAGHAMNFEMAAELFSGPQAAALVNDDVATDDQSLRRGVAGTLAVEKVVEEAAEAGADLETCRTLGVRVNERTRSVGVALTSSVPAVSRPTLDIDDDEMEMGVGIHGEKGRRCCCSRGFRRGSEIGADPDGGSAVNRLLRSVRVKQDSGE